MATVIHIEDNIAGYKDVVQEVMNDGDLVGSRISMTREIMGATIVLEKPWLALPVGIGRGVNQGLAAAEAASLIGGFTRPEMLVGVAPNFRQFMDNGAFHGAYGPRVADQYPHIERRLRETPDTRQAVASIWEPHRDLPVDGLRDYPCTLSHAFYVRQGKLVLHTTMRSNDVWWGWAYDAFMFTQVQMTMANVLGLEPGPYYHHAISLHLYQRDWDAAEELLGRSDPEYGDEVAVSAGFDGDSWEEAARRAQIAVPSSPSDDLLAPAPTATELWYHNQIKKAWAKNS